MQLFYNSTLTELSTHITFDTEESRHITKVLRKKVDDILHITNGMGFLFEARIVISDLKKCTAEIISFSKTPPKKYRLHLAVAPTKNNDRYEWFLEKATEIGINEITPIICERSERKIIKKERILKVVQSAMKQSLQTYLPKVNEPISYIDFLKKSHEGQLFIAHCEEGQKSELNLRMVANNAITILIGPEGDFTPPEIKLAVTNKFLAVSLGGNRLRTETAAIVACTMAMVANNH